ncbi:MAG: ADOP family duplicated permease [Bryobacteraceae bacterium]
MFWRRKERERDLERELRSDLDLEAAELQEHGLSVEEARYAARRAFGNTTLVKEEVREMWGWTSVEQLVQDLRYALRQLRNSPAFTGIAILVLAFGLGANVSLFTVINAVLLRPLPFPNPRDLVQIWEANPSRGELQDVISPYNFVDWQRQSGTMEGMAVYEYESFALVTGTAPQRMPGVLASSRFFDVFGIKPMLGRTFSADDDRPESHSVVLSYAAWQRRFNGDSDIAGKPITLNGEPFTVIGVMPAGFQFPGVNTEIWSTPAYDLKTRNRRSHYLFGIGRIKRGVTLGQAQAEMTTIARRLEQQYPDSNRGSTVNLVPLQEQMVGSFRPALLMLWGAVGLVLLIGCANIAHLLLARSVSRQREFAIRAALGAGRSRLIRQLLTESVILAAVGGLIGLALSIGGIRLLMAGGARFAPRIEGVHIDGHVLAFTSVVSLLTAILFGLLPAFRASRIDLATSAKQSGWSAPSGGSYRLRSMLVVSELALSVMLLMGAGLLIQSLWRLKNVNTGFAAGNVMAMRISLPESQYKTSILRAAEYQRMIERIEALPGVTGAAATNDLPFSGSRTGTSFDIEGIPLSPGESRPSDYRTVSSEYFRVMQIPLIKGRVFTEADNGRDTPRVAIINEALRHRYWPHADPLGQRLIVKDQDKPYEIVGVVGNVKHDNLAAAYAPEIYVTQYQGHTPSWTFLAIRSRTALESLIPAVRDVVREVAPAEPLYDLRTMQERVAASIAPQRFATLVLATFAVFALLLATIGIYGVVAFSVEQRRHEVGVRMALGARPGDVLRLVVRQGLLLGLVGIASGGVGSLAIERVLSSMLFGTRASDPGTFAAVSVVFVAITSLASYVPARRAALLDPMVALKYE